ncbi:unnamed protein product [Rotaria magnacalcarata]|uniref:N-acetyltransferase domain-containing protein n=4 Tax=Rotaria magnacalcarata TaxID=392030 RepID=A0A816LER0_9BILA|nr:unnamed protein product [Rotaria magnacalcarata]CAF1936060.1 unnamed protein product [Rotaria magnacalcarata]CAF2233892.1 unnamed protein product [Rotaria magnacalcarata]CAF4321210.1 unnamed protein product [Rotaria magnacalcarata]CAF4396983.1 unnamed protein product [Rotaria magnacalcarata]
MHIRLATVSDAEAITRVHYNAAHGLRPANFYTEDILNSWAPSPSAEHRINRFRSIIESDKEVVVVAELDNKLIIGFGAIIISDHEIRALYIDPMYEHQGVGSKILQHLEELALAQGVNILKLEASLNAETFYIRHGYRVTQYDYHPLSSGGQMKCVKMSKQTTQTLENNE